MVTKRRSCSRGKLCKTMVGETALEKLFREDVDHSSRPDNLISQS